MRASVATIAVALAVFAAYLFTVYPAVAPEDSCDYVTVSYMLDIPHAPGNPLYVLAGKLFSLIPLGNIAYRVNLLSVFFGILTLFLLYKNVALITGQGLAGAACALFFAFTYAFWYTTTFAKTFTFICFMLMLCLYFLFSWLRDTSRFSYFYLSYYSLGLGIGVHYLLLILVPVLFYLPLARFKQIGIRRALVASGFLVLGLSVYLYLPLRSFAHPPINENRPDTLERFINVLLRRDAAGFKMSTVAATAESKKEIAQRLGWLARVSYDHFRLPGVLFAAAGLYFLWRKNRPVFLIVLALYVLAGPVWLLFSAFPPTDPYREAMDERYLPLSEVLIALFMGSGMALALSGRYTGKKQVSFLLLSLFALPLLTHAATVSKRNNFLVEDFGTNMLKTVEQGAIMFAGQHMHSVGKYFQFVKKRRTDITQINSWPRFAAIAASPPSPVAPLYVDPSYTFYTPSRVHGTGVGLTIKLQPPVTAVQVLSAPWELFCYRGRYASGTYKEFYSQTFLNWYTDALAAFAKECVPYQRYDLALAAYKRLVSIGVFDEKVFEIRSYAYRAVRPGSLSAYLGMLGTYQAMNDEQGIADLEKTLTLLFPHSALASQHLALAFYSRGAVERAIRYAERSAQLEPENKTYRVNLEIMRKNRRT